MYSHYPGFSYVYSPMYGSYYMVPYTPFPLYPHGMYSVGSHSWLRQQIIRGRATWTEGGQITQCGIPWSQNEFMTVAVGQDAPYSCGESLKIRNPSIPGREVIVTVVDKVPGFTSNQVNLHRRAFEALGADLDMGVLDVEIILDPELEEEYWGKYLLEVVQTAYPNYDIVEYNSLEKTEISPTQTRERYEYTLKSLQDQIKVQGNVVYNPKTNQVISFDLQEV